MGRPWNIERPFKMPYIKLGDRSVETCEAYRRGEEPAGLSLLYSEEKFYRMK